MRDETSSDSWNKFKQTTLDGRVTDSLSIELDQNGLADLPWAAEYLFQLLTENVSDVIFITDMDLRLVYISESIEAISGLRDDAVRGLLLEDLATPSSYVEFTRNLLDWISASEELESPAAEARLVELELVCRDGHIAHTEATASLIMDDDGQHAGLIGVIRDVSTRHEAVAALNRLVDIERRLAEISTRFIRVDVADLDHEIERAIREVGMICGFDRGAVFLPRDGQSGPLRAEQQWHRPGTGVPSNWQQILVTVMSTWGRRQFNDNDMVIVERPAALPMEAGREREILVAAGTRSLIAISLVRGQASAGFLCMETVRHEMPLNVQPTTALQQLASILASAMQHRRDSVEKAGLEEQLRQSQKLEAIGTLAGGVAHDMNNVLTAILGNASLLAAEAVEGEASYNEAVDIVQACKRGQELTRNLLGFARKGKYRRERIDLNDILIKCAEILERTLDKRIRILTRLDPDLPAIVGDPGQIHHVLMNICLNAADAMAGDGMLSIVSEPLLESLLEPPARHGHEVMPLAVVQIRDTGRGMDDEVLEHAFDPFFTTKAEGEGTGLGLSMAYGTIKNHGGEITLESKPDEGTTVTLRLPAMLEDPSGSTASSSEFDLLNIMSGVVLIVEDEELVRQVAVRILEGLGCTVLQAEDGVDAVEVYKRSTESLTLVILDMVMPRMDGEEAFHKMREIDDSIPIVVASGYGKDDKIERMLAGGAAEFIEKPYDRARFSKLLKRY